MRRYASSKLRLLLLVALIGAAAFTATGWAQAQDPAPGAVAASPDPAAAGAEGEQRQVLPDNLFAVIFQNLDFVFWIILALSVVGVTLIIQGFIRNRAAVLLPESSTNAIREMITQKRFKDLIDFTEADPSFVSRALNPALKRAPSFSSMKEAMETSIGEQTAESFRKIEYLNIIGNLGPLLGLLGTVLGMIEAFTEMNRSQGGADPTQLAGGISKALAHTFLGLLLAVPCLACFGVLRTIVDRLTVRGALIAEELLLMVKPAEAKSVPGVVGAPPRPGLATPQPVPGAPTPRRIPPAPVAPTPIPPTPAG